MDAEEEHTTLSTLARLRDKSDSIEIKHFVTSLPADVPSAEFKQVIHFVYAYDEKQDCIELVRTRLKQDNLESEEIVYLCRLLVELIEEVVEVQQVTESLTKKDLTQDAKLIVEVLKECPVSSTDIQVVSNITKGTSLEARSIQR